VCLFSLSHWFAFIVFPGWDQGLVGMQTGGERILTCPPNFAYGKKGSKPDIPGNATLIFGMNFICNKYNWDADFIDRGQSSCSQLSVASMTCTQK